MAVVLLGGDPREEHLDEIVQFQKDLAKIKMFTFIDRKLNYNCIN